MSDDLVKRDFLIFKSGRGWYRAESKGYTAFKFDAGRYTKQDAEKITHPNGLDGPRDGMFYKHESEVSGFPSDRIEELEAKLELIQEEWHGAVYGDLENGVAVLNRIAWEDFHRRYPLVSNFGATINRIIDGDKGDE